MKTLIIVGVVIIVILSFYAVAVLNATEGYEDESGFHYGHKK